MQGFIRCSAILYNSVDTEDDELRKMTEREVGLIDLIVNINSISHVAQELDKCSIMLNNGHLIYINDEIESIIEKISKASVCVSLQ
jgi:hypothetical protein